MSKQNLQNKKVAEMDTLISNVSLYLNEELCTRCGICELLCPKEAIELGPPEAAIDSENKNPRLTVDRDKCVLCGVCDAACPFKAFQLTIDGEHEVPILDLKGFPNFAKNIEIDNEKCNLCNTCATACPIGAIDIQNLKIDIDRDHCITCKWCEDICVGENINVENLLEGKIKIDASDCPGGCAICLEICPTDAIYEPEDEEPWSETDNIAVDEDHCIYCGACAKACPVEGAISVKREKINVEDVKSLIWDEAKKKLQTEVVSRK